MKPTLYIIGTDDHNVEVGCRCGYFLGYAKREELFPIGKPMFECPSCGERFDVLSGTTRDEYRHRALIYQHIEKYPELLALFQSDPCFNMCVDAAICGGMSWEETLILAIKQGYKAKQDLFKQNVELLKNQTVQILLEK